MTDVLHRASDCPACRKRICERVHSGWLDINPEQRCRQCKKSGPHIPGCPTGKLGRENMPLTGWRLYRWHWACNLFKLACWVGGRHEYCLEWDQDWKVWYCRHCGFSED